MHSTLTEMEQDQRRLAAQQLNLELSASVERDARCRKSASTDLDLNTFLGKTKDQARDVAVIYSVNRFDHLIQPTKNTPYQSPYLSQPNPKELPPPVTGISMAYQGVDLTAEGNQSSTGISWHDPHPIFVILLVGPDEIPFGIQKDLLCAQSPFYRQEFAQAQINKVEYVVKLPDADVFSFGCFQNFVYTGDVYNKRGGCMAPDYPILMGVWKLATHLRMAPLRVAVLNAMAERRRQTGFIPSCQLLVEAWRQTEDDSGLRKMLTEWAAEHMRSNPQERSSFIRSLPKEILSALVIVLSDMPINPPNSATTSYDSHGTFKHPVSNNSDEADLVPIERRHKRARKSATDVQNPPPEELSIIEAKPTVKKTARKSEPSRKADPNRRTFRRTSAPAPATFDNDPILTPEKEMEYCRDLIKRMVSGPGYWTRYVPNFKKPVDPVSDNAPNYFDVVKNPMCLNLMKTKMENGEYASGAEFQADIQLIFQNCYEYWTPDDQIWKECEQFEDFFNTQWAQRSKYAAGKKFASSVKSEISN